MWESHSDSNRLPTVNYDSEVGSQSSDSRTWKRRKVVMDMERREPEAGYRKNDSGLGAAVDRWCQLMGEEAQERERSTPDRGIGMYSGWKRWPRGQPTPRSERSLLSITKDQVATLEQ